MVLCCFIEGKYMENFSMFQIFSQIKCFFRRFFLFGQFVQWFAKRILNARVDNNRIKTYA